MASSCCAASVTELRGEGGEDHRPGCPAPPGRENRGRGVERAARQERAAERFGPASPAGAQAKRRWFPDFCSGELITALAVTEPQAGRDLGGLRAR